MAGRYLAIRDYAAIGDGRTAALVARDGSIDWLCLPDLDSPSVFAAVLDDEQGGRFVLCPEDPYEVARRYLPDTNVLETTFTTAHGVVRITDALTLPDDRLGPLRELARRVEGLAGRVRLRWRVEPRFAYGRRPTRVERRGPVPVAACGADAIAIRAWDAGPVDLADTSISGRFAIVEGRRALLAVAAAHAEPLVFPSRQAVETRIDATTAFWRRWCAARTYDGPWKEAVLRSALALKLLVYAPSGAIAAAPTTSLPESIGGARNWDYRFCWIRDTSFALEALLQLGCTDEAHSFFWWFMHATRLTRPKLRVLYRLDGGAHTPERELSLAGYRGSRPVRIGNAAAGQLQLDTFGDLLDTTWVYVSKGHGIDADTGRELAEVADYVCGIWQEPDHGIWEVRMAPRHFTHSKVMCWVTLDRAMKLAAAGQLPARHLERWKAEAARIREFVDTRCWSERHGSYVRFADGDDLDAALLLMAIERYHDPRHPRIVATIEAIRRELAHGPLVYRYTGEDGLPGGEGVFLTCSFWLVEALALSGRREEAAHTMDTLVGMANDVGLYAEEIEPTTLEFLGNFPQGLVHLALISAAVAMAEGHGT
jgi:GH15 family glucan-1,4-alpha-glucosidase